MCAGEFLFVLTNLIALHFIFNWKLEKVIQRWSDLDFHAPIYFDQLTFSSDTQLGRASSNSRLGDICNMDSVAENGNIARIVKPPPSARVERFGGFIPVSTATVVPVQEDSDSVVKRFTDYGIL